MPLHDVNAILNKHSTTAHRPAERQLYSQMCIPTQNLGPYPWALFFITLTLTSS